MLFFVYGEFKRGYKHNGFLGKNSIFIKEVKTKPDFLLYDTGMYPVLVERKDGRAIVGELWDVEQLIIDKIEKFSECNKFKKITTDIENFKGVITYVFVEDVSQYQDCGVNW